MQYIIWPSHPPSTPFFYNDWYAINLSGWDIFGITYITLITISYKYNVSVSWKHRHRRWLLYGRSCKRQWGRNGVSIQKWQNWWKYGYISSWQCKMNKWLVVKIQGGSSMGIGGCINFTGRKWHHKWLVPQQYLSLSLSFSMASMSQSIPIVGWCCFNPYQRLGGDYNLSLFYLFST